MASKGAAQTGIEKGLEHGSTPAIPRTPEGEPAVMRARASLSSAGASRRTPVRRRAIFTSQRILRPGERGTTEPKPTFALSRGDLGSQQVVMLLTSIFCLIIEHICVMLFRFWLARWKSNWPRGVVGTPLGFAVFFL